VNRRGRKSQADLIGGQGGVAPGMETRSMSSSSLNGRLLLSFRNVGARQIKIAKRDRNVS
jgi:hypothetical protein